MAVTVTEAKAYLNLDDDEDDAELDLFVGAANQWVAKHVPAVELDAYPVRLGTLELIRHFWDSQRAPADGFPGDDDGAGRGLGLLGFAIPNRVHEHLAPYVTRVAPTGSFPTAASWPDPVWP